MILLTVETLTWSEIWIVTGLGFGIVLALLFCLVFIMQGLGWVMQKITGPKKPKVVSNQQSESPQPSVDRNKTEEANEDDRAAIAMALYLFSGKKHDLPTATIAPQARNTAWNDKSIGLNNKGF